MTTSYVHTYMVIFENTAYSRLFGLSSTCKRRFESLITFKTTARVDIFEIFRQGK